MRLALQQPCIGEGNPCHTSLCWESQHSRWQTRVIGWRWEQLIFTDTQTELGRALGSGLGEEASLWCPPFLGRSSMEQLCCSTKGSQGRVSRLWSFPFSSPSPPALSGPCSLALQPRPASHPLPFPHSLSYKKNRVELPGEAGVIVRQEILGSNPGSVTLSEQTQTHHPQLSGLVFSHQQHQLHGCCQTSVYLPCPAIMRAGHSL